MTDEREKLTEEQAIAMLPDGEYIHTFRNPRAGVMICIDWRREEVIEHIGFHGAELSGENATALGHGMVIKDLVGPLFIETRKEDAQ